MSGHIVHILHHASRLTKERGMLVCKYQEGSEDVVHELPFEDVRAVIVAARGVVISAELVAALVEVNAVILHCDHSYKPVGVTSGVQRVIRPEAAYAQANRELKLHNTLWKKILRAKVLNQARVLELSGRNAAYLRCDADNDMPDEAACARHYWREYFGILETPGALRHFEDEKSINSKLDYGYAVLGALIHRSIIAHGLSPVFGMHHRTRYQADAMVYDLMEPWRPFVDRAIILFERKNTVPGQEGFREWAKHIAGTLASTKLATPSKKLAVLDAIDAFVSSVANCYENKSARHLWTPEL